MAPENVCEASAMNSSALLLGILVASSPFGAHAQYSARQLTRKIVPQQEPQSPRPTQPAYQAARPPVAPQPESDRVRANREEAARKAVDYQKKRADEGSPQAQYDLGSRFLKGDGVERNELLGREWLQKAAKNGYIHAQRKLDELPKLSPASAPTLPAPPASLAPKPVANKTKDPAPPLAPSKN